ncbi:MAG: FkbM family methyltransferase, partial [Candidatus Binatia bacterium]
MSEEIVVDYGGKPLRFVPFGGRIERELRGNRFYEMQMLQYVEALRLGGEYADIGAYVGTHALFFATHCPATRVHAFEPRARVFELLETHVELNQLAGRVRAHQLGVSDRKERTTITLERKTEEMSVDTLDNLVTGPIVVMKIDVEGMEEKVLGGADRVLREFKPLILVEAHTDAEIQRDAAILAPHGYRLTGRVFNHTPTYELAASDSLMAPISRLPVERPLLDSAWWVSDHKRLTVEVAQGRMRIVSRLAAEEVAHISQPAMKLKRAPDAPLPFTRGAIHFLHATTPDAEKIDAQLQVLEYDDRGRTAGTRTRLHPRTFQRLDVGPTTTRIRVVV